MIALTSKQGLGDLLSRLLCLVPCHMSDPVLLGFDILFTKSGLLPKQGPRGGWFDFDVGPSGPLSNFETLASRSSRSRLDLDSTAGLPFLFSLQWTFVVWWGFELWSIGFLTDHLKIRVLFYLDLKLILIILEFFEEHLGDLSNLKFLGMYLLAVHIRLPCPGSQTFINEIILLTGLVALMEPDHGLFEFLEILLLNSIIVVGNSQQFEILLFNGLEFLGSPSTGCSIE